MDEFLIVVLFSALTGVMIGSLGTVVTFWLCGALERKTTLQFHCVSSSHHFRCDPALSVFASKCQGEGHAVKAALCDLGDPGWGIPGFCIELCCFLHPRNWPLVFLWLFLFLFIVRGHRHHGTQDVIMHAPR